MIMVKYVITVGLVNCVNQTTADFGKHTEFHIFVLHIESLVGHGILFSGHIVVQKIRINASACSLIRPVPLENRSFFWSVKQIGRHVDCTFPSLHNVRFTRLRAQSTCANSQCSYQKKFFHHRNSYQSVPTVILFQVRILFFFRSRHRPLQVGVATIHIIIYRRAPDLMKSLGEVKLPLFPYAPSEFFQI